MIVNYPRMRKRVLLEPQFTTFWSKNEFTLSGGIDYFTGVQWNGVLQWSTDKKQWLTYTGNPVKSSLVDGRYELYWRGEGNTKIAGSPDGLYNLTGKNIHWEGNIESLLDHKTVERGKHPPMDTICFQNMFRSFNDSMALISLPDFPAVTLSQGCYYSMFRGQKGIRVSETMTGNYSTPFRIPLSGDAISAINATGYMFYETGGTFTGAPEINKTYYLDTTDL